MPLPGLLASSTIVSTSDVGRLSTTYHPRSSSTSAAPDRPAPDIPVIKTMSAIPEMYGTGRAGSAFGGPQIEQARDGGRVHVLLRPGEEAGGRGGFFHALDEQAVGREGVDVAAERTVDEADEHVLVDL